MFTRKELIDIRTRATADAETPGQNLLWTMALMDLAKAADTVDAMVARSCVVGTEGESLEVGTEAGWDKPMD